MELDNKILGSDYLGEEAVSPFALYLFVILYNWNLIWIPYIIKTNA